jgi:hypothetical protein
MWGYSSPTMPARKNPFHSHQDLRLGERGIMFGGLYGYEFHYTLTNDLLTLEKLGCFGFGTNLYKLRMKAALKKVSPDPGDELRAERPEPDGRANRRQPGGTQTNRPSAAVGSGR